MWNEMGGSGSDRRGYDISQVIQRRDGGSATDFEDGRIDHGMMRDMGKYHEENNTSVDAENGEDSARNEFSGLSTQSAQDEPEVDEFGRLIPAPKKSSEKKLSFDYPPCFCERHSAEYALDARSGMFYHATSDFFFDPKSKLYYGNKQKLYYQFDDSLPLHRQFEPLDQQQQDTALQSASEAEAVLDFHLPPFGSSSKAISINLKTKILPVKTKSRQSKHSQEARVINTTRADGAIFSSLTSNQKKQHSESIDKWQERQQEREGHDGVTTASVVTTKKGNPVCMLCKRKFLSLELLRRHEQESRMHKENLAKKTEQPAQYLDRAQSRRVMHGNVITYSDGLVKPVEQSTNVSMSVSMHPSDTSFDSLGEQSIGRKLLLAMGGNDNRNPQTHDSLSKEWDRIETTMRQRK